MEKKKELVGLIRVNCIEEVLANLKVYDRMTKVAFTCNKCNLDSIKTLRKLKEKGFNCRKCSQSEGRREYKVIQDPIVVSSLGQIPKLIEEKYSNTQKIIFLCESCKVEKPFKLKQFKNNVIPICEHCTRIKSATKYIHEEDPVKVSSFLEVKNLLKTHGAQQNLLFNCHSCEQTCIKRISAITEKMHCEKCTKEQTLFKKHGVENKTELIEKQRLHSNAIRKPTVLKNSVCESCGVGFYRGIRKQSEFKLCRKCQMKQTKESNYGSIEKYNLELKSLREATNINRYGVRSTCMLESVKDKIKQSLINSLGVDNCQKNTEISTKTKQTKLNRYGYSYFNLVESKKTCLLRYGAESYAQSVYFSKTNKSRYLYNDTSFDSSWELAYFIFLTDKKINFQYKPEGIRYTDGNLKKHVYHPDFFTDHYVEIKGNHLLDREGNLFCCFKSEEQNLKNEISKYKQICMNENNVEIVSQEKINPVLDYVSKEYGKDYLKLFKSPKIQKGD